MIRVTIDEKEVEVEEGTTILEAADKLNIAIPTLCYHEALEPYGACRLCTVEITQDGRKRLVTACNYPIKRELSVKTSSEQVLKIRRMIMELLLARCPNVEIIRKMADDMGVTSTRFELADEQCILCGLCVRVCDEIVGAHAISFVGRGVDREVDTPFRIESDVCLACGACAYVCPTHAIKLEDRIGYRHIWHASHELKVCKICGNYIAPVDQLEFIIEKLDLPADFFDTCVTCRD
jgi:NADH dehydrogenase/NADH:ubiquinone oxidoreductase subunit G